MAIDFFVLHVLVSEKQGVINFLGEPYKMGTTQTNQKSFYHTSTIYYRVNLTNREDISFWAVLDLYSIGMSEMLKA